MVSVREKSAMAKKRLALRDHLWPNAEKVIWDRLAHKGFATIPKTMPFILKIMDEMTKGAPVGSTYLSLWCSTWDDCFVQITKPAELATASGFGGQRGEHTWATRMKKLQALGFIEIKAGKAGPLGSALIFNPHFVIRRHYTAKTPGLMDASYTSLLEFAIDMGVKDMLNETPLPEDVAAADLKTTSLEGLFKAVKK